MVLAMFVDSGHASLLLDLAQTVYVTPGILDPDEGPPFVLPPLSEFAEGLFRAQAADSHSVVSMEWPFANEWQVANCLHADPAPFDVAFSQMIEAALPSQILDRTHGRARILVIEGTLNNMAVALLILEVRKPERRGVRFLAP
jgi:hypothetical protein